MGALIQAVEGSAPSTPASGFSVIYALSSDKLWRFKDDAGNARTLAILETAQAFASSITAHSGTAIPAGGTTGAGLKVSSATNFGVFFGSNAPSLSAAKGSLYLRSDGTTTNDRAYINTDGGTTWTALITVA